MQNQQLDTSSLFEELRHLSPVKIRQSIRSGRYTGQTAGVGLGHLQGNVVILPADYALDFFRFCQRNPKPCPLVGVSDTGDPKMWTLGEDIDIRTDVPMYNVYREGHLEKQLPDITHLWRKDFVAFVLGCSFTFEEALIAEGIRLPHIETNKTVSMYCTSLKAATAGPFDGPIVVSMRPMRPSDAVRACAITSRYPHAHGEPVHIGSGIDIGVDNLLTPDWGDSFHIEEEHIPVFWACGVTPQVAIRSAKPPICITHAPGRMLITDIPSWSIASV